MYTYGRPVQCDYNYRLSFLSFKLYIILQFTFKSNDLMIKPLFLLTIISITMMLSPYNVFMHKQRGNIE